MYNPEVDSRLAQIFEAHLLRHPLPAKHAVTGRRGNIPFYDFVNKPKSGLHVALMMRSQVPGQEDQWQVSPHILSDADSGRLLTNMYLDKARDAIKEAESDGGTMLYFAIVALNPDQYEMIMIANSAETTTSTTTPVGA